MHQSPRLLASVVFAEHSSNTRTGKTLAEEVAARCGYDASLGIAQVKVRTAQWIERRLPELPWFSSIDPETRGRLARSWTRSELIDRLETPSTNLLYAAAYLALIEWLWGDLLLTGELRASRAGIIATLYSLGLERPDGGLRLPHPHPEMNLFGEIAQGFYDSASLVAEFPE